MAGDATETEIVAAFLCRSRCAVAVNDRQIEQLVLLESAY
ncbi:hypothetical protein OKW35_002143 [Paraburkholderia sp. MM5477-R1]